MSITVTEAVSGDDPSSDAAGMTLALPLTVAGGVFATVPQGSPAELGQSVRLALSTRVRERSCAPTYGTVDWTFTRTGSITPDAIVAALGELEPRADVTVDVDVVGARAHVAVAVVPQEV